MTSDKFKNELIVLRDSCICQKGMTVLRDCISALEIIFKKDAPCLKKKKAFPFSTSEQEFFHVLPYIAQSDCAQAVLSLEVLGELHMIVNVINGTFKVLE